MTRSAKRYLLAASIAATLATMPAIASAATIRFDSDPFAGSTALATPGRQVFGGNELFTPFDVANDVALFRLPDFGNGLNAEINFFNGLSANLPSSGFNVIVLNDLDFDGDSANGLSLNAGQAATLIANRIDEVGAGLFVYFNTSLNVSRLVFSTDLSDATADLSILARFTNQTGAQGIGALPLYTASNFVTAVPEPATWATMIAGFAMVGAASRRRRTRVPVLSN